MCVLRLQVSQLLNQQFDATKNTRGRDHHFSSFVLFCVLCGHAVLEPVARFGITTAFKAGMIGWWRDFAVLRVSPKNTNRAGCSELLNNYHSRWDMLIRRAAAIETLSWRLTQNRASFA